MKFRADLKDILIFIAFVIFLFFGVGLLVININSLIVNGESIGLDFGLIFTQKFLWPTLVFTTVFLIVIITMVSSYFFDREKGFGFSTKKADKGYSRWSKVNEIKNADGVKKIVITDKSIKHSGIPLIYEKNNIYVDDDDHHSLVIGSTASGKTQGFVMPLLKILAKAGESIVMTDPKGELYRKTSNILREKGYKLVVINLRNPQLGNTWNPLHLPYKYYKEGNPDKATELLDDLALNILYDESNASADPFWEKASANYFAGLALGLFEDATEEQININSINVMSSVGEDRSGASTYIKEYFQAKDPNKPAYINASTVVMAANETKNSILAVFKQKVKLFSSKENLSEMLSYSDFDMSEIGKQKTAVFIIIQDEKKTYHPLATTFIKQCYETLIDVAQENGGELPVRTNFVLDEFANMPPLQDVSTMITAARSRKIRFNLIIQNFSQLNQVYGKENAETIKGNCYNLIYLLSGELSALEEISKLCGDRKVKTKDGEETRPLISVTELQTLPMWTAILIKQRTSPFKTKITPDYKLDYNQANVENGEFVERARRDVQVFDIKEFVSNMKREKFLKMMNESKENKSDETDDDEDDEPKEEKKKTPFNLDDLVRRIDSKLAALDEEDGDKKEKVVEEKKEEVKEVKNEPVKEEVVKYANSVDEKPSTYVTDDQFFDDFFMDD